MTRIRIEYIQAHISQYSSNWKGGSKLFQRKKQGAFAFDEDGRPVSLRLFRCLLTVMVESETFYTVRQSTLKTQQTMHIRACFKVF